MKQCEMKKACDAIKKIDNLEDLEIIRRQFNLTRKALKAQKALEAKSTFSVGDKIVVNSRKGSLSGTIVKVNRTRAVCDINGSSYNVPFSIMEAV
tara:strand:+ start:62 stop:346 length:285 start_codon:yes stop_codon:yes gene_type:complete